MGQPTLLCCGTVCGREVTELTMLLAWLLPHFLSLPLLPTSGFCPFMLWFPGGWVCVRSRTPLASLMDSPVRLGVSLAASTPIGFYSRRFWVFSFPHWNPGFCGLSHSPVLPPGLSVWMCDHSVSQPPPSLSDPPFFCPPLFPGCTSPPPLPVWMTVFLIP